MKNSSSCLHPLFMCELSLNGKVRKSRTDTERRRGSQNEDDSRSTVCSPDRTDLCRVHLRGCGEDGRSCYDLSGGGGDEERGRGENYEGSKKKPQKKTQRGKERREKKKGRMQKRRRGGPDLCP